MKTRYPWTDFEQGFEENMIKGLDDDEIDFLELVDRSKMEEERKKCAEEEMEMADFRNKVATLQEKSLEQRIQQEVRCPPLKNSNIKTGRTSQTKLLAGVVVKKRQLPLNNDKESSGKRRRSESEGEKDEQEKESSSSEKIHNEKSKPDVVITTADTSAKQMIITAAASPPPQNLDKIDVGDKTGGLTCIGILPGLGTYSVSSDESDCSTDIEEDTSTIRFDLLGRRIKAKTTSNNNK